MKLYPEYLMQDRPYLQGDDMPVIDALEIESHGATLYGIILRPEHTPGEKHPLVLTLHGFPGHCTNNDLAHALRRMGCVVINPFYRGAWGSGGYYTISGLPDDVEVILNWAVSDEIAEKYHIDTKNVFLAGHSMGGFTTINTMRRIPWIKAGVCMAPYDPDPAFHDAQRMKDLTDLIKNDGTCLKQESATSIYDDIAGKHAEMAFTAAYEDLKDRNIYFLGAKKDTIAMPDVMIEPLFEMLKAHKTDAVQKYDLLDTDHSFDDMRIRLSVLVGNYIASMAD